MVPPARCPQAGPLAWACFPQCCHLRFYQGRAPDGGRGWPVKPGPDPARPGQPVSLKSRRQAARAPAAPALRTSVASRCLGACSRARWTAPAEWGIGHTQSAAALRSGGGLPTRRYGRSVARLRCGSQTMISGRQVCRVPDTRRVSVSERHQCGRAACRRRSSRPQRSQGAPMQAGGTGGARGAPNSALRHFWQAYSRPPQATEDRGPRAPPSSDEAYRPAGRVGL